MDLMTHWLDGSIADSDGRSSSVHPRLSKSSSKQKGSSGTAAKKGAKAGKKGNTKMTTKTAADKKLDVKHAKLVRDSFTIPGDELQLLTDAKKKCLKAGIDIKKSELIRIGISLVYGLGLSRLKKEKRALQPIKTGRPKKSKLE